MRSATSLIARAVAAVAIGAAPTAAPTAASTAQAAEVRPKVTIGVAGVPRSLGETRDYDRIFSTLREHGIELFFPIFLYQEAPEAATLGFETDFIPPCRPDDPAFAALRAHGIGLIVPAGLLYDRNRPMPPVEQDPLAALIACAGEETIFAITSYDEPVHTGVPPAASEALYRRVKAVAPDMPVIMVHAPLKIEPGGQDSEAKRRAYLVAAEQQSAFADIVGFDTYPIPPSIAKIGAPGRGGAIVDETTAVREYLRFIGRAAPGKRYHAVLQNFAYADQFSPQMLTQFPAALRASARAPTRRELERMAEEAVAAGASVLIWYGGAYMDSEEAPEWGATLDVSAKMKGGP